MAQTTISFKDLDVQILNMAIQGAFAQGNAFVGSGLASAQAVITNGTFDKADPKLIGTEITIPRYGVIGDFVSNPDGTSVTPSAMSLTNDKGTITRDSLGNEITQWAANSIPGEDPYTELGRQVAVSVQRAMDKRIIDVAATSPLLYSVYNASSPVILDYAVMADACAKWNDETNDMVAIICHSRAVTDLRKLVDNAGRPLLIDSQKLGGITTFMGVPVVQSDRVPLDGSSMGAVTSAGSTPPVLTITGTPMGAFDLKIIVSLGGANATAKIQFSTDGGTTYSDPITTATAGTAFDLIDTAADSLVGVNGNTGLQVAFASGTFNTDNTYTSKAKLAVTSMVVKKQALGFWYNQAHIGWKTQPNVLNDSEIGAMHLYAVAHLFKRVPGGTKPGVVRIKHNVSVYQ